MAETKLNIEQFADLIATVIDNKFKELGLDKVDLKHGKIPTQEEVEGGEEIKDLSPAERFKLFMKGVIDNDVAVVKDLGGNVDSAGGFTIPDEFQKEIIRGLDDASVMRPLIRVVNIKERTGEYPTLTGKPTYTWQSNYDNTAFTQSEPTFGQITYAIKRLDVYSAISRELLADSAFNLERLVRELFTEAYADAVDTALTIGKNNATIPIQGFQYDANITEMALSSAITYDDIVSAFMALKKPYRSKAVWMTSSLGIEVLRKVKDNNGLPILTKANSGAELTIFGRPVIENVKMEDTLVDPDGTANSGDEYYTADLVFGDFKYMYMWTRNEFGIEGTTTGGDAFLKNQLLLKSFDRWDAKITLHEPFVKVSGVK
jgi:HK97 family phage major capsid protein